MDVELFVATVSWKMTIVTHCLSTGSKNSVETCLDLVRVEPLSVYIEHMDDVFLCHFPKTPPISNVSRDFDSTQQTICWEKQCCHISPKEHSSACSVEI